MITDHKNGKTPIIARTDTHSKSFKFTFNLSPKPVWVTTDRINNPFIIAPSNTFIVLPNYAFNLNIPPYNHQKCVSVVISPKLLYEVVLVLKVDFPRELFEALENPDNGYYLHKGWITPSIKTAIEQILNCPYHGDLKRIYL